MKRISHRKSRFIPSLLALGLFAAGAAQAAGEAWELVSRNPVSNTLINGNRTSYPAVSADGRYIAFESSEGSMVTPAATAPGGGSLAQQIFLFDRKLNRTEVVSVDNNGQPASSSANTPTISADGCKVVFSTSAKLSALDLNQDENIYLRDRCATPPVTQLIGATITSGGYLQHRWPDISADGRYVAFEDSENIYVHDIATNATTLISMDTSGVKASGRMAAINADGSRVAFWSYNNKLVADDSNGFWDIFLWDRNNPKTPISRVSTRSGGGQGSSNSGSSSIVPPGISPSGRYVVFPSRAKDLVGGVGDEKLYQLFVKDTLTDQTYAVSVNATETPGDADTLLGSARATVNDDGWVLSATYAKNLAPGATAYTYLLLRNFLSGVTTGLLHDASGSGPSYRPVMTPDSRFVVTKSSGILDGRFDSSGVFLHDRTANCLFNGLEGSFPSLLSPVAAKTGVIAAPSTAYTYRYYSGSKAYLAVAQENDHLYYLPANGQLLDVGPANNWVKGKAAATAGLPQFACPQ